MLKLIFVNLLWLSSAIAQAQMDIGLGMGGSINYVYGNTTSYNRTPLIGFSAKIPFYYWSSKHIAFVGEVMFMQKKHSAARIDIPAIKENVVNSYVLVPIGIQYFLGKGKLQPFGGLGIYGGYWLASRREGRIPDVFKISNIVNEHDEIREQIQLSYYNERYVFSGKKDNRFDIGVAPITGVKYGVASKKYLVFSIEVYNAIVSSAKRNNNAMIRNHTFCVSISYMVHLNH